MIFDVNNGHAAVTKEGLCIPQLKKLFDDDISTKAIFNKQIDYLFFVYGKMSPYADMLITDRKQIVCKDILKDTLKPWLKQEDKELKDAIKAIMEIQYSPKERLMIGAVEKIEEYLNFWKETKIDEKNHNLVAETLDNANKLLKLKDTIEKQVLEEKSQKQVGGSTAKIFENN